MIHVAIMKKQWGLIPKILKGTKIVESRWYKTRRTPWNKVKKGDILYFKDSGHPVTVRSKVIDVKQYEIRNNYHALEIMQGYALADLGTSKIPQDVLNYITNKKYAIFVWFDFVEEITPFQIDKTGFGMQSAWLVVKNINKIQKNS